MPAAAAVKPASPRGHRRGRPEWIYHSGWYPDRKVRLYRRDVSRMDGLLHDSVRVAGDPGSFEGPILHYTFATFSEHIAKINRYTSLMAREDHDAGRRGWFVKLLVVLPWSFFRAYVLQQGFRDGARGLLISVAAAVYGCLRYLKLGALVMGLPVDPPAQEPPAQKPAKSRTERCILRLAAPNGASAAAFGRRVGACAPPFSQLLQAIKLALAE